MTYSLHINNSYSDNLQIRKIEAITWSSCTKRTNNNYILIKAYIKYLKTNSFVSKSTTTCWRFCMNLLLYYYNIITFFKKISFLIYFP